MPLTTRIILFIGALTVANSAFGAIFEADFEAALVVKIFLFICFAAAVNIPFGSYRNLTRKFSIAWWLAIHLPIPFIIVLRTILFDLPLWIIPTSLASAVFGQMVGSQLALFGHRREEPDAPDQTDLDPESTQETQPEVAV